MGRHLVLGALVVPGALVLLGSACGPAWEACLAEDPPPFCQNPAVGAVSPEPFAGPIRTRECCRPQCDDLPDSALEEEEVLRRQDACEERGRAVLALPYGAGSAGEELLIADWPTAVPEAVRHRWAGSVRSAGELARKENLRGVARRLEVQPVDLPAGLVARAAVLVTESWDYLPLPAPRPAYACGGGMVTFLVVQAGDGLDLYSTGNGIDQGPCGPSPSSLPDDPGAGERTDD